MTKKDDSAPPFRAVLIEDDLDCANLVRMILSDDGFDCLVFGRGEEGLDAIRQDPPDVLILDRKLPGRDGISICREARDYFDGPILFLSALDKSSDIVSGLETGGDDYLAKPFEPEILLARVYALLRRCARPQSAPLEVDRAAHTATMEGVRLKLTPIEFSLLSHLQSRSGEAVPREALLEAVWGEGYIGDRRVVDVHIRHLREKMSEVGDRPRIATVRGLGYRLE